MTGFSEALILSEAAGANPAAVRNAIKTGFASSTILENHGKRILNRNFKPGGKCSTQLKDMKNIIETARDYNIHLPISNKVKKLYADIKVLNSLRKALISSLILLTSLACWRNVKSLKCTNELTKLPALIFR